MAADTFEGGIDELRERIFKERKFLRGASDWPGGIPDLVRERGDAPAGGTPDATKVGQKYAPVKLLSSDPYERWVEANVVRGVDRGTISATAYSRLGDVTTEQFRGLADIQRDFHLDIRITNRQNFALRDLAEADLRGLYDRLQAIGMAEAGAELARDVVSCPGADTCNLAVTQSRGLAAAVGDAPRRRRASPRSVACASTSRAARTAAASTTSATSGSSDSNGAPTAAPRRATRCCSAATSATPQVEFGDKATKVPAKNAPEAVVRIVRRFNDERTAGEEFHAWLARSGGAKGVGDTLTDLDHFPAPDVGPEFYVDYDETGPYVADVGDGECAAT